MAGNLPTKKQRELLSFIDGFIKGNGYAPSFREIQRSLAYKSVSTVATHVDGLIAKGYLRKVDNSARTLEVCTPATATKNPHVEWLETERDKYSKDSDEFKTLQLAIDIILKSA
ncbi:MAG TPA: hypothetical protein VFQ70_04605 [Candidatus Saccharimonadaceae bacterium]|nr:hypothetical protein [Candidatus Saccharimonadaceae bacterium]